MLQEKVKENLQNNMIIKNYKEMCKLLDEKMKTGESKQIQLRDWSRYFSYKKDGHKFIIEEIFEKPFQREDKRSQGNHTLFCRDVAEHILLIAAHPKLCDKGFAQSRNSWLKTVGLVSENYGHRANTSFLNNLNYNFAAVNDFYDCGAGAAVVSYLESGMNYLQRTEKATIKKYYVTIDRLSEERKCELKKQYYEEYLPSISEEQLYNDNYWSLDAYLMMNEQEDPEVKSKKYTEKEFVQIKEQICQELGLISSDRKANMKLREELLKRNGWKTYYLQYEVLVPGQYKEMIPPISKEEYEEKKRKLNKKVYEHLVELTKQRYARILSEYLDDVKSDMKNAPLKIGKMQERFTETYRTRALYARRVDLPIRIALVDYFIKMDNNKDNLSV